MITSFISIRKNLTSCYMSSMKPNLNNFRETKISQGGRLRDRSNQKQVPQVMRCAIHLRDSTITIFKHNSRMNWNHLNHKVSSVHLVHNSDS